MQILLTVIRKTWGYQKKADWISLDQFVEATNMSKTRVCHAIRKLIEMNLIAKNSNLAEKGNAHGSSYCPQKDYDKWKPIAKKGNLAENSNRDCQKQQSSLLKTARIDLKSLLKTDTTIDKEYKDTITKDTVTIDKPKRPKNFSDIPTSKIEELKQDYPDLDFDKEFKKCVEWWAGGSKKLQRPVSALRNWLERSEKYNQENRDEKNRETRKNQDLSKYDKYT